MKQLVLNFSVDSNARYLGDLIDNNLKYSQSQLTGYKVRYYANGANIMSAKEARAYYPFDYKYEMYNDVVLIASLRSDLEEVNPHVARTPRRCSIPFGLEFHSMTFGGMTYSELPVNIVWRKLKQKSIIINTASKQVQFIVEVPSEFSLENKRSDYTTYVERNLKPLVNQIHHIAPLFNKIDAAKNEHVQSVILTFLTTVISSFSLTSSTNMNETRILRNQLIEFLRGDNVATVSDQGRIDLLESRSLQTATDFFPVGTYEVEGAFFKDRQDYETKLKYKDLDRPTTYEDFIDEQKQLNRYEFLTNLPLEQRLLCLTGKEITKKEGVIDVMLGMTEDEAQAYMLTGDEKYIDRAQDRWINAAEGRNLASFSAN